MAGVLLDTTIYITALRSGDASILSQRRVSLTGEDESRPMWLSAVVSSELLVGAGDERARGELLRMEREFEKLDRLLVPTRGDWLLAGQILAQIGAKHGYEQVGRTRMMNDALIALSARSKGLTVLTKNAGDFERIAEFRKFEWRNVDG